MKAFTTRRVIEIICAGSLLATTVTLLPSWVHLRSQNASLKVQLRILSKKSADIVTAQAKASSYLNEMEANSSKLVAWSLKDKKLLKLLKLDETIKPSESAPKIASTDDKDTFESIIDRVDEVKHEMDLLNEQLQNLNQTLIAGTNISNAIPSITPSAGYISSNFGRRKSPMTGRTVWHRGVDIAAYKGTPIYASADGVISYAGWKGAFGKLVTVNHGLGLKTRYGHAHKLLVKPGQTVKRGQKIALMGRTGRSTGSHLHYEVLIAGRQVNPKRFLDKKEAPISLTAASIKNALTETQQLGMGGDGEEVFLNEAGNDWLDEQTVADSSYLAITSIIILILSVVILVAAMIVFRSHIHANIVKIAVTLNEYKEKLPKIKRNHRQPVNYWEEDDQNPSKDQLAA